MKIIVIPFPFVPFELLRCFMLFFCSLITSLIVILLDFSKKFDFIYVRDVRIAFAFTLWKNLKNKLIVKIPAFLEDEYYNKFGKKFYEIMIISIDRKVLNNVFGLIVHSKEFARSLILKRQIKPKFIFIIPPGVIKNKIERIRKFYSRKIHSEEMVVGFLGLLEKWQGIEILPEIIAELNRMNYNAKLLVIGDGPEKLTLIKKCKELNVKVEITGPVSHEKALYLLRKYVDFLVLPRFISITSSNIIPIKVIEALALNVPVIVTDIPIYKRLIGNGVFLSKRDAREFAKIISDLFNRKIVSVCAKESLLNEYYYESNVRRLLKILAMRKSKTYST
ncbi:MAG: glycosyltransferase family 4 protein [Nitrososphaerota archaeon]